MNEQQIREQRGMDIIENSCPDDELTNRDDIRAAAVDVLTDILHALNRYGFDAEGAHAMAWCHYMAEQHEAVA